MPDQFEQTTPGRDTVRLLTLAEYEALEPRQQGYIAYMQAAHDGSPIPDRCPYALGTAERKDWEAGQFAAVLDAMEGED